MWYGIITSHYTWKWAQSLMHPKTRSRWKCSTEAVDLLRAACSNLVTAFSTDLGRLWVVQSAATRDSRLRARRVHVMQCYWLIYLIIRLKGVCSSSRKPVSIISEYGTSPAIWDRHQTQMNAPYVARQAGIWFAYPKGIKSWVDVDVVYIVRLTSCQQSVARPSRNREWNIQMNPRRYPLAIRKNVREMSTELITYCWSA